MRKEKQYCKHCAPYEPTHLDDYLSLPIELILRPASIFSNQTTDTFILKTLLKLMELIKIGKWQETKPEEHEGKIRCLLESAKEENYRLKRFHFLNNKTTTLKLIGEKTIIIEGQLPAKKVFHHAINDKGAMRKLLKKHKIPVPKGGVFWSTKKAAKKARELGKCVIKPRDGSLSKHITVLPKDNQIEESIRISKQVCPSVIIEEYIEGPIFRATIVHGKFQAATKRVPKQKGGKVTMAAGSKMINITDQIPPENIKLFEQIAAITKGAVLGIDIITQDITIPYTKQRNNFAIIELNSWPAVQMHHNPDQGEPIQIMKTYLRNL